MLPNQALQLTGTAILVSLRISTTPAPDSLRVQGSQPVVLVTQGTVATDPEALIVPTLRALAQEDVLIVPTTAGKPIESIPPDAIPANARIESVPAADTTAIASRDLATAPGKSAH